MSGRRTGNRAAESASSLPCSRAGARGTAGGAVKFPYSYPFPWGLNHSASTRMKGDTCHRYNFLQDWLVKKVTIHVFHTLTSLLCIRFEDSYFQNVVHSFKFFKNLCIIL